MAHGGPVAVQHSPARYDHNAQAMILFRGDLYVTTLEDGLIVRSADGWKHFGSETLVQQFPAPDGRFPGCAVYPAW